MAKPKNHQAFFNRDAATASSKSAFERRDIIDEVKGHFKSNVHCPRGVSVVLYGGTGLGKRTIANQVAREVTAADGRRIFAINGQSIVTFICDYCSIYEAITGQTLPRGLGLRFSIPKVRHLLESRQEEWFLVITDLSFYLEQDPHLCSAIPTKGHVLITSKDLHFPEESDGQQVRIGPDTIAVAALAIARTSTQVYAKGLFDKEVYQLARQLSPKLLNISWYQFGKLQRWARAAPLFLRITMINLQLLRLDFAAYRDQYERSFDHSRIAQYQGIGWYSTAFNVACSILWQALGDRDAWAQRLLHLLAMVYSHPIPMRLIGKLPIFRDTASDQLSPALDVLASYGIISINQDACGPAVSIIHRDLARWVYKHGLHRPKSGHVEHRRLVEAWAKVFDEELAVPAERARSYPPYVDSQLLWSLYPLINMFVTTQFHLPRTPAPSSEPILGFLVNTMESTIYWWPLTVPPGYLLDETVPVLLSLQFKVSLNTFNSYYLRIRLCRMETHFLVKELAQAEQYLRQAKRSLRALELYEKEDDWSPVVIDPNWNSPVHLVASVAASSSSTQQQQTRTVAADSAEILPPATPVPPLLVLQRRTEDLEIALFLAQRRYADAKALIGSMLKPASLTSLSDPCILAQRHCWMAEAFCASMTIVDTNTNALRHSHQTMMIWANLPEDERWAIKGNSSVKVLDWVMCHVEQLFDARKFKGASLFLPRLIERWVDMIPSKMNPRVFGPAKRLVECLVKIDQVDKADEVVENLLETIWQNTFNMKVFSGFHNEHPDPSQDMDMKLAWEVLIELARGHREIGNFAIAEGLVRFAIGSWRRRHVGSYEELAVVSDPNLSKEEQERTRNEIKAKNTLAREGRDEREATWKATCPVDWWDLLIDILTFQGRCDEARRLVRSLVRVFAHDKGARKSLRWSFATSRESCRKMRDIYQRACEIEESGWTREWQRLLGKSRESFFLRKAVKAFGSPVKRVKRGVDFASDFSVPHGRYHARESRILYMLDRFWSHAGSGYLSRMQWGADDFVEDIATFPVKDQKHMCDLWKWCGCRKRRSRASSLPWFEYQDKWWTLEVQQREQMVKEARKWQQTTLDDWIYLIIEKPARKPSACKPDCPCINANLAGLAEQAALEKRLWLYTEPLKSSQLNPKKQGPPYKRSARPSKPHEFDPGDLVPTIALRKKQGRGTESLKWFQPEFDRIERSDENYIIPNAVNIPAITITSAVKERECESADGPDSNAEDEHWFTLTWRRDLAKQESVLAYVQMSEEARRKHEDVRSRMWGLSEDGFPIDLPSNFDGSSLEPPGEAAQSDDDDAVEDIREPEGGGSGSETDDDAAHEKADDSPQGSATVENGIAESVHDIDAELRTEADPQADTVALSSDPGAVDIREPSNIEMSGAVGVEAPIEQREAAAVDAAPSEG